MKRISEDFVRHFRADGAALASLSEALSVWAMQAKLPARTAFHLDLVLDELLTNIVEHGVPATCEVENAEVSDQAGHRAGHRAGHLTARHTQNGTRGDKRIEVEVRVGIRMNLRMNLHRDLHKDLPADLSAEASGLEVYIRDNAQRFNPLSILGADLDASLIAPLEARKPGGLGIHFVKSLTQVLQYTRYPAEGDSANTQPGYNEMRLVMRTGFDVSPHN